MPRRRRHGVGALLAVAAVVATAGCQADLGTAGCRITRQVTLPGSALTLLQDARLDVVDGSYVLIGYDSAANVVRWASLAADGTLGMEHAFGLAADAHNPLFAVAAAPTTSPGGTPTPGDTVLIGYLANDAASGTGALELIAVPADGTPPAAPASAIVQFPKGAPPASDVAMASSRNGMRAGLAWVDAQVGRVMYAAVDGAGAEVVPPAPTAPFPPDFSCLTFAPGKDDLTILYYTQASTMASPAWVIAEANESGGIDSYATLMLARAADDGCATLTPTPSGYSLVWQNNAGAWLSVYKASDKNVPTYSFAPANEFGGSTLQPPIVGLALFDQDYGVLFQQPRDAELWRLDPMGQRRSGALVFPSAQGNMGTVSALPVQGTGLVATYADYTGGDGGAVPGDRVFVNAACY
jgi:hypothetical protein